MVAATLSQTTAYEVSDAGAGRAVKRLFRHLSECVPQRSVFAWILRLSAFKSLQSSRRIGDREKELLLYRKVCNRT